MLSALAVDGQVARIAVDAVVIIVEIESLAVFVFGEIDLAAA